MRADLYAAAALNISRNKAAALLKNGEILIDGKVAKCSDKIAPNSTCALLGELFVSRAAHKLLGFLNNDSALCAAIKGARCIDVGAAAGGFTQILLRLQAASVVCVDVGREQLDESIKSDARVRYFEGTDVREFAALNNFGAAFDFLCADLSFISLGKIINSLDFLVRQGGDLLLLFKPQFEVGPNAARSKMGVVKDARALANCRAIFERDCAQIGWILVRTDRSQLAGKEGNYEYFYHFKKP